MEKFIQQLKDIKNHFFGNVVFSNDKIKEIFGGVVTLDCLRGFK
mgnify:CR=1 FL=1